MADFSYTLVSEAVDLVNDALAQLNVQAVDSTGLDASDADQTDVERLVDRQFHRNIKYMLRQGAFKSITKTADLSSTTDSAIKGWNYIYSLPSDFLRNNAIFQTGYYQSQSNPLDNYIEYKIESGYLLTNFIHALSMAYNYYPSTTGYANDAAVTTAWNGYFQAMSEVLREAIVYYLAVQWAYPMKRDSQLKANALQEYEYRLQRAKMEDRSQEGIFMTPPGPLVDARGW